MEVFRLRLQRKACSPRCHLDTNIYPVDFFIHRPRFLFGLGYDFCLTLMRGIACTLRRESGSSLGSVARPVGLPSSGMASNRGEAFGPARVEQDPEIPLFNIFLLRWWLPLPYEGVNTLSPKLSTMWQPRINSSQSHIELFICDGHGRCIGCVCLCEPYFVSTYSIKEGRTNTRVISTN